MQMAYRENLLDVSPRITQVLYRKKAGSNSWSWRSKYVPTSKSALKVLIRCQSWVRNGPWEIAKTWIKSPSEQREIWCWRVQMVTPFGYFHPDGTFYVWPFDKTLCPRAMPKRGLGDTHGCFFPKSPQFASRRVAFGGPDDRESAHLAFGARIQSMEW